jgi:hypothetical protein
MVARMQIKLFEGRQSCGQRSARWFGVILHGGGDCTLSGGWPDYFCWIFHDAGRGRV